MIKAILFDVGGVLIENPTEKRCRKYAELCSESQKNIKKKLKNFTSLFDAGKISSTEFWLKASKELGIKKRIFKKIWVDEIKNSKKNTNIFQLAKSLKLNGYKIGILSTSSTVDTRILNTKQIIYSIFHPNVFLSFKIGYSKPSEKIYRFALKKLKLKPNEVVFIDNRKEHVVGAKKVGMVGLYFTSYQKFVYDLKKLKVL